MSLPIHPIAALFPPMSESEFRELVMDIEAQGQREPVTLYDGAVIDGVHRVRACEELGREPLTKEWDGDGDVTAYVISMNLHRRHLTISQRAMIAAKLVRDRTQAALDREADKEAQGRKIHSGLSYTEAAAAFQISEQPIKQAKTVLRQGAPELIAAAERGEVAVSAAARAARQHPKDRQMAAARAPRKMLKRDPQKPRRDGKRDSVLDRADRAIDTMETMAEALAEATRVLDHDRRRASWAKRLRPIRQTVSRFIARCEAP